MVFDIVLLRPPLTWLDTHIWISLGFPTLVSTDTIFIAGIIMLMFASTKNFNYPFLSTSKTWPNSPFLHTLDYKWVEVLECMIMVQIPTEVVACSVWLQKGMLRNFFSVRLGLQISNSRFTLLVYDTSGCSSQGFSWSSSNRYLNRSKLASTWLCNNHIHTCIMRG